MNSILNGGDNMFDNGNIINIGISSLILYDVNYGTSSFNGSSYGFYVAKDVSRPHTSVAFINDGPISFGTSGKTGSAGNAVVENYSTSYSCTNGRYGTIWANINYSTINPTIGDIWFTVENNTWSSIIDSIIDVRKGADTSEYGTQEIQLTGQNYMFCKTLLSRSTGLYLSPAVVTGFVSSFVENMALYDGGDFNLIDLSSFISWNDFSDTFTSLIPDFYNYTYDG
jgi:hypothetical protein